MDLSAVTQGELPIPMHAAASPFAGSHVVQQLQHEQHGNNNNNNGHESSPALPSPPAATTEDGSSGNKHAAAAAAAAGASAVKYRECLKNHAAAMGGNATDGCGEFMPSGEEGSLEALKCSACGCHRNFHRKELDDVDVIDADGYRGYSRRLIAPAMPHHHHHRKNGGGGGLLVTSAADPLGAYAAAMRAAPPLHHQFVNAPMPLSAAAMQQTSESDEMDGMAGRGGSGSRMKRFRTKFTTEQKARMLEFAEGVGWRLQKLDDAMVQAFCQEIGVKRRVLKVWMHNNKHNLATRRLEAPPPEAPIPVAASPPQPPQMPQMPMAPPPPPASQPGPSFLLGDRPSSPPPEMEMPMAPPPFHRGPGSPPPRKLD